MTWLNGTSSGAALTREALEVLLGTFLAFKVGGAIGTAIKGLGMFKAALGGGTLVGTGLSAKVIGAAGVIGKTLGLSAAVFGVIGAYNEFKTVLDGSDKDFSDLSAEKYGLVWKDVQAAIEASSLAGKYAVNDWGEYSSLITGYAVSAAEVIPTLIEEGFLDANGRFTDAGRKAVEEVKKGMTGKNKEFKTIGKQFWWQVDAGAKERARQTGYETAKKLAAGIKSLKDVKNTGSWLTSEIATGITNSKQTIINRLAQAIKDALSKAKKDLKKGTDNLKPPSYTKSIPSTSSMSVTSQSISTSMGGVTINVADGSGDSARTAKMISYELKKLTEKRKSVWA